MNKFEKTIDYFINYELMCRLSNIELKKGKGIYISKERFSDINSINEEIIGKKEERIKDIVNKISFKEIQYSNEILPDIISLLRNDDNDKLLERLKSIIDKNKYNFKNNYDKDISNINKIILDNSMYVLYPILARGDKKIPLITFECSIKNNRYIIENYKIQQEAFRVIIASIFNCGINEVRDMLGDEFFGLLNSLANIKGLDIFETIKIIEDDIKGKFSSEGFTSFGDIKNYENWAVTEEIVVTIEVFEELQQPVFGDELRHLKEVTSGSNIPDIVKKYLFSNENSKYIDNLKNSFHYGSYSDSFSINEKQWKVISAYNSNSLISVSGPPGTGKTTVLKEIVADNFVRKIKGLINVWDKSWVEYGQGNQKVFCSPFNGSCFKSMVLTSTNNDAVDNIGLELLKEVEYFNEIAKNELSKQYKIDDLKGIFCAKLGNRDNMVNFKFGALMPLMNYLNIHSEYDEKLSMQLIEDFQNIVNQLNSAEQYITHYIESREEILNQCIQQKLINDDLSIESIQYAKKVVEENKNIETELINNNNVQCSKLESKLIDINNIYIQVIDKIQKNEEKIKDIEIIINKIQKISSIPLIGKTIVKLIKIEEKNGTREELYNKLNEIKDEIEHFKLVRDNKNKEYKNTCNDIDNIKLELNAHKQNLKEIDDNIIILKEFDDMIKQFDVFKRQYLLECNWNDAEYSLFNDIKFTKYRNELFNIGLKINELYIKKNSKEIIFNLEKVYPDRWFQNFYRSNYIYDENYTKCIKSMWETIFLCFPIVTTTLHSFEKNKFHMIEGIFDTIMFDEAGQALIHTAVAPLYRSRNAVVVGDIFQLEPIRGSEERLIERYNFDSLTERCIDIEQNSVQSGADQGADVYEMISTDKLGIVLEEHRRCEKAIVEFSNSYVYEKRLIIVKDDEPKDFLGKNLSFIDVRGVKNKNNENHSEANICVNIVNSLVKQFGEKYKSKIGIIAPFKNQTNLLKKRIANIDIGTVHSFQGQEKEIIILSTVIDDTQKNSGIMFVGKKPNFLNVAFTRAKKQLIIIGNYEAYKNSNNYLKNAIDTIEKYGYIYSIYNTELSENISKIYVNQYLEIINGKKSSSVRYEEFFKEYISNGLIVDPKKHYEFLINAIKKSIKSIYIISPWITKSVVNDEMVSLIKQKIINKNEFYICFGYNKSNYTLDQIDKIVEKDNFQDIEGSYNSIKNLKDILNDNIKYMPPIHTKALIIDDEYMLIGSHNWLSNSGGNNRDEISCIVCDQEMIEYVKKRYF